MALPVTIAAVQFPDQNYYCGPFKAPNGSIYVMLLDAGNHVEVLKCSDFDFPGSAFAVVAGAPAIGNGDSAWAYLSGTKIHIVQWRDDGSNNWYLYHCLDTLDDSWAATSQVIDTWDDKFEPTSPACSFAFRADDGGEDAYICLYNGPDEKIGGSYYDRVSYATDADGAGAWGNATNAVDAGGELNYSGCVAVRGSVPDSNGHVVHFFYGNSANPYLQYVKTLRFSAGWGLSGLVQCPTNPSGNTDMHKNSPGVYFYDSGTDRILVTFRAVASEPTTWMVPEDASGDVDGNNDSTSVIDAVFDVNFQNHGPVACLAVDQISGEAYIMWGEVAGDGTDLRRNVDDAPWSSWPASAEEEAGTCTRISCNVYARNGSLKLAFVWDDGGTIKYDEYDIGQETAPALTAARLLQQNYHVGPEKV